MTTPRDSHRSAVYTAEDALAKALDRGGSVEFFGSTLTLPVERRFADVASIQDYVDRVLSVIDPQLPPIIVRERAASTKAHYEHPRSDRVARIAVPLALQANTRWAARESVVLHEIAHHLAHHDPRGRAEAAHGPVFCGHLLALHERIIGPETALMLRAAFDAAHIPCSPTKSGRHQADVAADGDPIWPMSGVV